MKNAIYLIFQNVKNVGILNLIANIIDNFTHGIAVAGSFQASFKVKIAFLFLFNRFFN